MNGFRRTLLALAVALTVVIPAAAFAAAPSNDNFSASGVAAFPAEGATYVGTNFDATAQSFEPDHASSGFGAVHSIWYSWTPQVGGTARLHTCDSAFNTRVAVYTGDSVDTLTPVAANEDSTGPTCAGTAWAELSFAATAGVTYRIAVDTSGDVTPSGASDPAGATPTGTVRVVLTAPTGTTPEQPPAEQPPAEEKTTPGTPVAPRVVEDFRILRLIASCGDDTPKGNDQCRKGPFEFKTAISASNMLRKLAAKGIPTLLKDTSRVGSKGAKTPDQQRALLESGTGGEITFADIELENPDGSDVTLQQGQRYNISTDQTVTLRYSYFDLAKDKAAIADEKAELRKEAERQAAGNKPKSKCLPIAAGESDKQILDRFPPDASGFRSYLSMFDGLAKLGCQIEISKLVRGKPSAPRSYVSGVSGRDAKRDTISVVLAQPGSHDFIFSIREQTSQWLANQYKNSIPLGTDGKLTTSKTQVNRFTVQVIERASGRFVPGIDVTFDGKTQTTDGNGETTFSSLIRDEGSYRLSAEYKEMEGWRTIRATNRGSRSFTSLAGRNIKASQGRYVGNSTEQLQFAAALPVLPANLGSGDVGEVVSIPRVQQATVTTFDSAGSPVTGQHNVVDVPNNSNVLVGAGPGLLALGGGTSAQVAGRATPSARAGIPNPLEFLAGIVGGVKAAIDAGSANVRSALTGANQAAIAAIAQALNASGSNLISDKGLGVISVGGGNLIGQAGGNLISDKGLGVISVGGGNLIGQAGGNLISDKGLGVISTGGGNLIPVFGGKVISTGGLN